MRKTRSLNLKGVRDCDKKTISGVVVHVVSSSRISTVTAEKGEEVMVRFMLFTGPEDAKRWLSLHPRPLKRSKSMRSYGMGVDLPSTDDGEGTGRPKDPICVFLKGRMNYRSIYFFQTFRCLKAWDPVRGVPYFRIDEILLQRRLWDDLVFTVCESILLDENGRKVSDFVEFLEGGFSTSVSEAGDPRIKNTLAFLDKRRDEKKRAKATFDRSSVVVDWFFDDWLPKSEFNLWTAEMGLREYVPAGIEILTPGDPTAVLREEEKLEKMLASEPDRTWILTEASSIAREFVHIRFSPVTLEKIQKKMNPVHLRALTRYAQLKSTHMVKRKETSFSFDVNVKGSRSDLDDDPASFAFLTETAKFLVPEILEGRPVYTFDKHFDVQTKLIKFMDDLCRLDAWTKRVPIKVEGYVPDDQLTDLQLAAVEAVETLPFVIVMGLPGRGKSRVISEICRRYVSVKSVTAVAALAAETRKRIPHCETIGMARKVPKRGTEILIIDEFEDNSDSQALKAFTRICPDLIRLVVVFDPLQIAPIKPGCQVAIEFAKAFRDTPHVFVLKDQFRFSSDEVARNDEMLLKGSFSKILHGPDHHLEFVSGSLAVDSLQKLKKVLVETAVDFCAEEKGPFQYIALTNAYKDAINDHVEGLKNPKKFAFYSGQRIVISDGNYKKKTLVPWTLVSAKVLQSEGPVAAKKLKTARDTYFSDACNNGETYVVDHFVDFDVRELKWIASVKKTTLTVAEASGYDYLEKRRCIVTRCGKTICIHPEYVPVKNVHVGWAITVNKAKGLEYDRVAFAFNAKDDKIRFGIHHAHVALTRGKKETKVLNTPEAFFALAKRTNPKKIGTMRTRLVEWYENFIMEKNEGILDREINAVNRVFIDTKQSRAVENENRFSKRKRVE